MLKNLAFTLFFLSYGVFGAEFFMANGDRGIEHYSSGKSERLCRKYGCKEFDFLMDEVEKGFIANKLSDKETLKFLRQTYKRYFSTNFVNSLSDRKTNVLLKLLQTEGQLDSVQYFILDNELNKKNDEKEKFQLKNYYLSYRSTSRAREKELTQTEFYALNKKKLRRRITPLKEFTARQRLYLKFNGLQIKKLAGVFNDLILAVNSTSGQIQIDYDGDNVWDRTEKLSSQERYRLGIRLLQRDFSRLQKSPLFKSVPDLSLIDLISASLEVGVIDREVLHEVLKIKELSIVKASFFKRHKSTFFSLGKIGALTLSTGGPLIITAITLVEIFSEGKKKNEVFSPDHIF